MKIDTNGLNFLRDVEGMKLVAYKDTGGVPTIGIGSTRMFGKPVAMGLTCTEQEAYDQCLLDMTAVMKCINDNVKVTLSQNQFNSLCSFVYNVGEDAFLKSTLLRLLNSGDYAGVADQFLKWVFDNKKYVEGLHQRRIKERNLFLK